MSVRFVPEKAKSGFTPTQYALVDDGFYAGFFSRYSVPRMYPKWNGEGEEMKIYLAFIITHAINERPLPRITLASTFVPFKRVYIEKNGLESKYLSFEHALLAKKFTKNELANADDESIPTLDDLIGRPAVLQIVKSTKPNKDGVIDLRIKEFQAPTSSMEATLRDWYKSLAADGKIEYGKTEKDELRFMASPKPATDPIGTFQNPVLREEVALPDSSYDDDFPSDSEIPF